MTVVAVASENADYDGALFVYLLERLGGAPVERWDTPYRFDGRKAVLKLLPTFLGLALEQGVRHALVAIDNDGGSLRHPERDPSHRTDEEAARPDTGCSVCGLEARIPSEWRDPTRHWCIAVPVQTLETWLLVLRGDPLDPSPEQVYSRRVLKKRFFGSSMPPVATRREQALHLLRAPDALERPRALRSFRHFEAQVKDWPAP